MALSVGDRATQYKAVASFIIADQITIVGMFSPNGFRTIQPGAKVKLVFDNDPGSIREATITGIPQGVGQGEIAVSGTLAKSAPSGASRPTPPSSQYRRISIAANSSSACPAPPPCLRTTPASSA